MDYKCPKCGEDKNLHYNYDWAKQERPIIDVLCNECGEFFGGNDDLYSQIERAIIKWSNDGTKTAGILTREIMDIIYNNKVQHHDVDFMYKWINKHSKRKEQNQ